MAKIEKVTIARVKNNLFDFDAIRSFRTKNYVGEWVGYENGYELCEFIVFNTKTTKYISDKIDKIHVCDLDDLMNEVETSIGEEIIEVYNEHITTINIDIPM